MNTPGPNLINATVRLTRIRSKNRHGCIAFGHRVDFLTGLNDRAVALVVSVPAVIADPSNIAIGGIYEVYGEAHTTQRTHGSYTVSEIQVEVQGIRLVRPSGSQLIQWLADNVPGIREVKATRLWDVLGESLYESLDNRDHESIRSIIPSEQVRDGLFEKWGESGDAKTLRFVQERDIPLDLARKVIRFHGKNTVAVLIEDPYRLLSFEGNWQRVDGIARDRFGLALDDARRLAAAIEEALYRVAEKGHTCATLNDLRDKVGKLLKPYPVPERALAKALLQGKAAGQFVSREAACGELMLHAPGSFIMERQCAEFIVSLLHCPAPLDVVFPTDIDVLICDFEREERLRQGLPAFALNDAQWTAVRTSFNNRFSIITGGAGVGKTTVLKALYRALDTLGRPRFQMALSGRATARMIEATQQKATTIAGFLRYVTPQDMGPEPVIVIDEASMLDLVTFYRLVCKLPAGAQLILVGDPYQLPPIGAGLILHVLCNLSSVPSTQLTEVKRQAKESAIPAAALAIRDGKWPEFSSNVNAQVVFLPCADEEIIPTVMQLYDIDRERTQILGATRSCPFAGVATINRACHAKYASHAKPLLIKNSETDIVEATGFCEGDLLLYTANDWPRNLQNGCLGRLTEVFDKPRRVNFGDEDVPIMRTAIAKADFEGVQHYILDTDVDVIDHAYSITVHKAQGSQFRRVIVPVRRSRVLDRTFLYTAITRSQVQVILVGDSVAVREAVLSLPKAFMRRVGLPDMLRTVI